MTATAPSHGRRRPPMRSLPPGLIVVAHGSRDPRHARVVAELAAAVRAHRPDLRVEPAFLDHCAPSLPQLLTTLESDGVGHAVAVPLLLTPAYHVKVDLPRVLRWGRAAHPTLAVDQAAALGPHPLLVAALERRLREAGVRPGDSDVGVVLGAAGTSDPRARSAIDRVAADWARSGWADVECAYASAGGPTVEATAASLRERGARHVVLAPYVLAPGVLPDRLLAGARAARLDASADVIGAAPEVVRLVAERYEAIAAMRASA